MSPEEKKTKFKLGNPPPIKERSEVIAIRVTPEEKHEIKIKAYKQLKNISEYLRAKIDE